MCVVFRPLAERKTRVYHICLSIYDRSMILLCSTVYHLTVTFYFKNVVCRSMIFAVIHLFAALMSPLVCSIIPIPIIHYRINDRLLLRQQLFGCFTLLCKLFRPKNSKQAKLKLKKFMSKTQRFSYYVITQTTRKFSDND